MKKTLFLALCVVIAGFTITSCSKDDKKDNKSETKDKKDSDENQKDPTTIQLKEVDQTAELKGSIDNKYAIKMNLNLKGNDVTGTYYYVKNGADNTLNLKGTLDSNGMMELHEYDDDDQPTGHFKGKYSETDGYSGTFVDYKGNKMPFKMEVEDVTDNAGDGNGRGFLADYDDDDDSMSSDGDDDDDDNIEMPDDLDDDDDMDDDDDNTSAGSGSVSSIDEWLDTYEELVDEAISISEDIKNNDMSALAEYSKLSQKIQKLQSDVDFSKMTASQRNRFQNLLQKIQNIQK